MYVFRHSDRPADHIGNLLLSCCVWCYTCRKIKITAVPHSYQQNKEQTNKQKQTGKFMTYISEPLNL